MTRRLPERGGAAGAFILPACALACAAALIFCVAALPARAENTTAAFLKLPVDARAVGMGAGITAVSAGAASMASNPAGLSQTTSKELSMLFAPHVEGSNLGFLGYSQPFRFGTLGLTSLMLRSGGLDGRDDQGRPTGGFSAEDRAFGVSFGRQVLRSQAHPGGLLGFGVNAKYISSKIGQFEASSYAVDLGAQLPRRIGRLPASFGLAVRNLGPGLRFQQRQDPLPLNVAFGVALQPMGSLVLTAGGSRYLKSQRTEFSVGTEVAPFGGFFVRGNYGVMRAAGMASQSLPMLSWGLGFRHGKYQFDYAFMPLGELGATQRLNVTMRLGAPQAKILGLKQAPPAATRDFARLGWDAVREGRVAEAALLFQRALDAEPGNDKLYKLMSRSREVMALVPQVVGSEDWAVFGRQGIAAFVDGRDLHTAVVFLRQAYDRRPADDKLLGLLNLAERAEGAAEPTRRGVELGQLGFVDSRLRASRQAIYDGRYALAAQRAGEVLELDPKNIQALELLGSSHFMQGRTAEARKVWLLVLKLDPENKTVADFIKRVQ